MKRLASYAGIGSRGTPARICEQMERLAIYAQARGIWLRTGGAPAADQAFIKGSNGCFVRIYLPWPDFQGYKEVHDKQLRVYTKPTMDAFMVASQFHPAWAKCSPAAHKLLARNANVILSRTLTKPVDLVICW